MNREYKIKLTELVIPYWGLHNYLNRTEPNKKTIPRAKFLLFYHIDVLGGALLISTIPLSKIIAESLESLLK